MSKAYKLQLGSTVVIKPDEGEDLEDALRNLIEVLGLPLLLTWGLQEVEVNDDDQE